MLKLPGKDSGSVIGGVSKHQAPLTSASFSGAQSSSERPVVSWYQSGKPPIWGSALTGPTRWRAAWAGEVRPSTSRAADADTIVSKNRLIAVEGMFATSFCETHLEPLRASGMLGTGCGCV